MSGKSAHECAGDIHLVESRTKYANEIHGLLSDHGITEDVKPLNVNG